MRNLLALLLFVPSFLMAQVPDHVPTDGLVAWYPLYDSLDEVVGGHDGQSGSPTFESDGGLLLQTGDSPVNLPESLEIHDMDGSLTVGGWIRLDDADMVWRVVMDLTDGDEDNSWTNRATLSMENVQGELRWTAGLKTGDDMANNISRVLSLPDPDIVGLWRHVMAVWDVHDVVKIYVNGSPLDGSLDISDAANFNLVGGQPGSRRIGGRAHNTNQDRLWHGAMKDIGVWGRALSAAEIQNLALVTQQPGCTDSDACNYNADATVNDGSCDYCSCVGEFHLGASFSNPIVAHGAQELYTPWGAADLSGIDSTSVTKLVGGEGFFVALKESGDIAVICPDCSNSDPIQFDQPVIDIAAGRGNISAVLSDGSVVDFGANSSDYGTTDISDATHCARAWGFGMALKEDGSLQGWGNFYPSPDSLTDIIAIDAGVWHAVALTSDGRIHEWGYDGQSGEVLTSSESIASLTGIADISAGTSATMAIFEDGSAKAWTWPDGLIYLDIPASEGVVDGAVNWSISTYITYDGRSVTSNNFGNVDTLLNVEPQIACGVCVYDFDGNGVCNEGAVLGCIDSTACNYDIAHTIDDGSCIASGCMESNACNFNPLAQCAGEACDFTCCPGPGCCMSIEYWDADLQLCVYPAPDTVVVMVPDTIYIETASPFASCGEGTVWDPVNEECIVAIPTDTDFNGCVTAGDVLNLLATFGTCPPIPFSGPCQGQDHVTYQGYDYDIVAIGEQCWFAENLRVESYANGDLIASQLDSGEWGSTNLGAMDSGPIGKSYNWFAVIDDRGLCPELWHVAYDHEWIDLELFLGMDEAAVYEIGWRGSDQGSQLKSSNGWDNGGTNSAGFSAIPESHRQTGGSYVNDLALWWCVGNEASGLAISRNLNDDYQGVFRYSSQLLNDGLSVRCIKD